MTKLTIKLTAVWMLMCFFSTLSAQVADTVELLPEDAVLINDSELLHELLFGNEYEPPEENLNDLFGERLEDVNEHPYYENSADTEASDIYPTNLPDSLYIARLQEIEQGIDLSYNSIVKNFLVLYSEERRELVERMLGLSDYYFPIFEETLDRYDVPLELKYLPIIESALNPIARSRAGANGLWQFMFATGRQMQLDITTFVDERRDPVLSTDAAVRYLKQLYDTYEDWHLAIAAYNCGPGNVNRAIRRTGGKRNYWEIYYYLPRETRGYVPAFIAASYIMNYYSEHNLMPAVPEFPIETDTIMVNDYLHFDQLVNILALDIEEVRALNPMYRRDVIPAKSNNPYPVVLPENKIMEFIDRDTAVFAWEREKYFPNNTLIEPGSQAAYVTPADIEGKTAVSYTVKSGDNVGFISEWYDIRASDLRYWNNIDRNLIRIGQTLVVYVPEDEKEKYEQINGMTFVQKQQMIGQTTGSNAVAEEEPLDPDFDYYTVKSGDTLWDIAQQYAGISSDEIMRLNNLSNDRSLRIGQKLKIRRRM